MAQPTTTTTTVAGSPTSLTNAPFILPIILSPLFVALFANPTNNQQYEATIAIIGDNGNDGFGFKKKRKKKK